MAKTTKKTMEALVFLQLVKGSKTYADLVKAVEKAGFESRGIKLRLASLRKGGIVIPKLDGEDVTKTAGKSRKERMADLATAAGFKFDPKQFVESKGGRPKATAK